MRTTTKLIHAEQLSPSTIWTKLNLTKLNLTKLNLTRLSWRARWPDGARWIVRRERPHPLAPAKTALFAVSHDTASPSAIRATVGVEPRSPPTTTAARDAQLRARLGGEAGVLAPHMTTPSALDHTQCTCEDRS